MNKINYPIYSISNGLEEDTVFISGGNGKGFLNGLVYIRVTKDAKELLKSMEFPDVVSATATCHKNKNYVAMAVGSQIKLYNKNFFELNNFDTKCENTIFHSLEFSRDCSQLLAVDGDNNLFLFSIPDLQFISCYPLQTQKDTKNLYTKATFFNVSKKEHLIALVNEDYFKLLKTDQNLSEICSYSDIFQFEPCGIFTHDDIVVVTGVNYSLLQSAIIEMKIVNQRVISSRIVHPVPDLISAAVSSKSTLAIGTSIGDGFILNLNSLGRQRVVRKISKKTITALCPCNSFIVVGNEVGSISYVPNHARIEQFCFLVVALIFALVFSISMIVYINT